jgi:type VI secretion system protein ImpG
MDQRLIQYYNRELGFIQEMGAEFARHFPKVAGRLGMEGLECADPYVERLLEGFAFLSARVNLKLDSEFPQFCQHLLEIIYPDYLAPLPSMAVVQFMPETDDAGLADGFVLERGSSLRSGLGANMQTTCEYRTAHEVQMFPIKVVEADYISTRAGLAKLGVKPGRSVLCGVRIVIETTAGVDLSELKLDKLPFFLAGRGTVPLALYEQILGSACGLSLMHGDKPDRKEIRLPTGQLQPLGFEPGQALLNYRSRSFDGYRLLREYFAFPERYRFINFVGLQPHLAKASGKRFELIVHMDTRQNELENVVDNDNFLPFCSPIVNLFPKRTDRIRLNERDHEFHIVPDRSRPMDYEVHQVEQVHGHGDTAAVETVFLPFYALKDRHEQDSDSAFYTLQRRPRQTSTRQKRKGGRSNYLGQEVFISLVDANQAPYSSEVTQLGLKTWCTNRDLPLLIPLGQKGGDFWLEVNAPVREVKTMAGPTRPSSMGLVGESRNRAASSGSGELAWRLIDHLTLNFLSLVDESPEDGAKVLREILELYAGGNPVTERHVNGLLSVGCKAVTRRLDIPGPISFGRGLEITLVLEESAFEAGGMYLFGSVITEFFRKYVSINNITETVVRSDNNVEIGRWPVKMGRRPVL